MKRFSFNFFSPSARAGGESGRLGVYPTTRKRGAWWGPRSEQLPTLPDGEGGWGRDRVARDGAGPGASGLAAAPGSPTRPGLARWGGSEDQENYPTLAPRTALEWGTLVSDIIKLCPAAICLAEPAEEGQ